MTTGLLDRNFACGHAAAADWRKAADACLAQCSDAARGANLGFVYATDRFADCYGEIVEYLRAGTGIAHWVGTVGLGICASGKEYLDEPALAVLCCEFPKNGFQIFSNLKSPRDVVHAKLRRQSGSTHFGIVHADPATPSLSALIRELAARAQSGFIVGGLSSSRGRTVQYADKLCEGGVSGVMFSDEVVLTTRLSQGCTPLGPHHLVTDCRNNVLISLDGRPALDVFHEDVGPDVAANPALVPQRIFAGLGIDGSDTGDYVVRNLTGIDPARKLIAVADAVKPGSRVLFCQRDRGTASDDLDRMLNSIQSGLYRRPKGGIYFSCLGRGASLFGEDSEELRMIQDALGEVPLVGFFCNGEISHNRVYGYTGVLTLFL